PAISSISLVMTPCRSFAASAPVTLTTPRSGSSAILFSAILIPVPVATGARFTYAGRGPEASRGEAMSDTFDLVLKGGTVVNHDGVGVRDVGVRAGRIAAIGSIDPA